MSTPEVVAVTLGPYQMGETIGKGSFGKVKKGVHSITGETVAIKILNRKKLQSSNMDKKIRREIKILKLFRHPHICRLYDVFHTSTDIFLVMEYVDGIELYDYIAKTGKLPEDTARKIFQQLIGAVEYCHHFRVVHRDLKPENILLDSNMQLKLIDFGLSNVMQDSEFLKTSCGSPNYAAPEVISGRLYAGPEIDVWSCGIVMYALLCGCLPFDEDTIPLLFAKIKKGKFSIPPHVPAAASELLTNIIVVDPLQRLTIPQIRDSEWFEHNLPSYLRMRPSSFNAEGTASESGFDDDVVAQVATYLQRSQESIRHTLRTAPPRHETCVTYSILVDAKSKKQILSASTAPETEPAPEDEEFYCGMVLTASPLMDALLDLDAPATQKQLYNSSVFLPQSAHSGTGRSSAASPSPHGGGVFCVPSNASSFNTSMTQIPSSLNRPHSLAHAAAGGGDGPAGSVPRPLTGSVAKMHAVFDAKQEAFLIQNNVGWRLGLMTDFRSNVLMGEIYSMLEGNGFEWRVESPFVLHCRPAPGNGSIVVAIHTYRLLEKHDKGFIIDFRIVRGHTMKCLDTISVLSHDLYRRIGTQGL